MKIAKTLLALASFLAFTTAATTSVACEEGSFQCGGNSLGGAAFVCKDRRWEILMDCGPSESCTTNPVPTCSPAKVHAVNGADTVTDFDNAGAEVEPVKDIKNTNDTDAGFTTQWYNPCSPCIHFYDNCKIECKKKGSDCDRFCNGQTCTVNLLTGDVRRPTVSCGRFCKWPCY